MGRRCHLFRKTDLGYAGSLGLRALPAPNRAGRKLGALDSAHPGFGQGAAREEREAGGLQLLEHRGETDWALPRQSQPVRWCLEDKSHHPHVCPLELRAGPGARVSNCGPRAGCGPGLHLRAQFGIASTFPLKFLFLSDREGGPESRVHMTPHFFPPSFPSLFNNWVSYLNLLFLVPSIHMGMKGPHFSNVRCAHSI